MFEFFEHRDLVNVLITWINDPKDYQSILILNRRANIAARHHQQRFIEMQFKFVAVLTELSEPYRYEILIQNKLSDVFIKAKPNMILRCVYHGHISFVKYIRGLRCDEDHIITVDENNCDRCLHIIDNFNELTPNKSKCRFTKCMTSLYPMGFYSIYVAPRREYPDNYLHYLPMDKYSLIPRTDGKIKLYIKGKASKVIPHDIQSRDDAATWIGILDAKIHRDINKRVKERYKDGRHINDDAIGIRFRNTGFLDSKLGQKKVMGTVSWYVQPTTFISMYDPSPPPPQRDLFDAANCKGIGRGRSNSF